MQIKSNKAVSREESIVIKGLAILLVVLGHNKILIPEGGLYYQYIYSFHIYIFFILPFLYDKSPILSHQKKIDLTVRLLYPYLILFTLCFIVYYKTSDRSINTSVFSSYLKGLLNIHGETAGTVCGATFLWFLPSFLVLSFIRNLAGKNMYLFWLFFLLSSLLSVNVAYTWHNIYAWVPLYAARGLFYFFYGTMAVLMMNNIPRIDIICVTIFSILSFGYLIGGIPLYEIPFSLLGFFSIKYLARQLQNNTFLIRLGKMSLSIYLIHQFVYFPLYKLFKPFEASFIAGGSVSLFTSEYIMKHAILRTKLFPNSIKDLKKN